LEIINYPRVKNPVVLRELSPLWNFGHDWTFTFVLLRDSKLR